MKSNGSNDAPRDNELFPLSIIHINDVHARFEETNELSAACKPNEKCIGGYGRAVTKIKELMTKHAEAHENPIYLNSGDSFQGTMWYTFGRWNVTSALFNLLNADAITLGNHDFIDGIPGVVPFMTALKTNVIVANIDDTDEPMFQGKYKKSIIIDRYKRKIGVIGVILRNVDKIADTGKLRFINESVAIQREATELKEQGVDIIIVLSHCGLHNDYVIAKEVGADIDIIVGGHSHTFMYTVENETMTSPGPDKIQAEYPAVVEQDNGHRVLIVQASAFLKYVGDLTVYFDRNGELVHWSGAPIYLDSDIVPDPDVIHAMMPWKQLIDEEGQQTLCKTEIPLLKIPCHSQECHLGNLITDAFVQYYLENRTSSESKSEINQLKSIIGLISSGTLHSSFNAGDNITYNDLMSLLPFENTVDSFELRGNYLKELFEHAVDESWSNDTFIGKWLIQVSGARVIYNMSNPIGNRAISIEVYDHQTTTYQPIDPIEYYLCVAQKFLNNGGSGYKMIYNNKRNLHRGPTDIEIVRQYLKRVKVIRRKYENRLTFLNSFSFDDVHSKL